MMDVLSQVMRDELEPEELAEEIAQGNNTTGENAMDVNFVVGLPYFTGVGDMETANTALVASFTTRLLATFQDVQDAETGEAYTLVQGTLADWSGTTAQAAMMLLLNLTQVMAQVGMDPAGLDDFRIWAE